MPVNPNILVNGGLVETRDPTLFGEGELAKAQDAYYKANNPAIWSVLGRQEFNATQAGAPVLGFRALEYDGAPDVFVIHTGRKLREAPAGLTGLFVDKVTDLTSDGVITFDTCHYNNQQILMDGVNRNRVRDKDGTYRFQGMLENIDPPVYSNTGAGTGFSLTTGDTITYWIEEQVRLADGTIKRRNASPGRAQTVTVTGTGSTIKPVITRPPQVNPDATHWVVYATSVNGTFPIGAAINNGAAISVLTIEDVRTASTLPAFLSTAGLRGAALAFVNEFNQNLLNRVGSTIPVEPKGLPAGEIYQTVVVAVDNIMQVFPKNGPPPISTTADVMEDSVLMLDAIDRSRVWFTFPDDIDSTPYTNFIRFETKGADEVQWARFLGRGMIVALRDSLWRIDTLPQPTDAAFQIGRVKVQLEGAHGGIGALNVAPFSFGQQNLLAYVSRAGIMVTDGETWSILTGDVDWQSRVDITKLPQAHLTNNPIEFRLEFTYTPVGGALNSETMLLHYHPSHVKPSNTSLQFVKVTLPVRRGGLCKGVANVNGNDIVFSGQTNGKVYHEWIGVTDPLGNIEFDILTGDRFPGGVGRQARVSRGWIHHQAGLATQRATAYAIQRTEGQDDVEEARNFPLKRREHTSVYADLAGEAFQFGVRATNPPAQIGIDFIVPEIDDEGEATAEGEA